MSNAYEKRIQNQFGGFCTKVLKNEARRIHNEYSRQREQGIALDTLSLKEQNQLSCEAQYFNDEHIFDVDGAPVVVAGDRLSDAISRLNPQNQKIILLFYFLDLTDREISQRMGVCRQSVSKRRNCALRQLYKCLTEETYK